eukprot:430282-Prorocentrum_minimum.AAC.1
MLRAIVRMLRAIVRMLRASVWMLRAIVRILSVCLHPRGREASPSSTSNVTSLYGSSCADNGKDALSTPETLPEASPSS